MGPRCRHLGPFSMFVCGVQASRRCLGVIGRVYQPVRKSTVALWHRLQAGETRASSPCHTFFNGLLGLPVVLVVHLIELLTESGRFLEPFLADGVAEFLAGNKDGIRGNVRHELPAKFQ